METNRKGRWRRDTSIDLADELALKADILAQQGQFLRADELYTQALALNPTNADLWAAKAITLEGGLGRSEEALKAWAKAKQLDHDIALAFDLEDHGEAGPATGGAPVLCGKRAGGRERLIDLVNERKDA
jgi:tetratricopeptide (TPR) repeat protein